MIELRDAKTLMGLQARYNLDTVLPEMEWLTKP
jgi:hypothetical protein